MVPLQHLHLYSNTLPALKPRTPTEPMFGGEDQSEKDCLQRKE